MPKAVNSQILPGQRMGVSLHVLVKEGKPGKGKRQKGG